jgi:hypothetical protein
MVATFRPGVLASLTLIVPALFACNRAPEGGAHPAPPAPALDAQPGDAAATFVEAAVPPAAGPAHPSPMRGFRCSRVYAATKSPQGALTVQLRARSAADFTYHIAYHCEFNCRPQSGPCDYAADIRMKNGELQGSMPRVRVMCVQSTVNPLAVDCGPYLNSTVGTVISGRDVTHSVSFRVWPMFADGIPDPPTDHSFGCLPFVLYDKKADGSPIKHLYDGAFAFKPEECRVDDADGGAQ